MSKRSALDSDRSVLLSIYPTGDEIMMTVITQQGADKIVFSREEWSRMLSKPGQLVQAEVQ
jgi:hypothetical protein